jgi:hypothetical protein
MVEFARSIVYICTWLFSIVPILGVISTLKNLISGVLLVTLRVLLPIYSTIASATRVFNVMGV